MQLLQRLLDIVLEDVTRYLLVGYLLSSAANDNEKPLQLFSVYW